MEVEQRMRDGGDRVRHWGLKRDGPKCEFGPMMKGYVFLPTHGPMGMGYFFKTNTLWLHLHEMQKEPVLHRDVEENERAMIGSWAAASVSHHRLFPSFLKVFWSAIRSCSRRMSLSSNSGVGAAA